MDKERSKAGKLESFAKNKIARATAAVALTFAAASAVEKTTGYDTFPNVDVAHADGPTNPSFETQDTVLPIDTTLPDSWDRQFPSLNNMAYYHYGDGVAHTGTSSIEGRYMGYDGGSGCTYATNAWDSPFIDIADTNKKYSESFFAAYFQDATSTVLPQVTTYFYNSSNEPVGTPDDAIYSVGPTYNVWEQKVRTFGPGGDIPWPTGTAKIKMRFLENVSSTTPCVDGTIFGYIRYDDVSVTQVPLSVGGVAEAPNLTELQAIKDANKDDESKLPLAAGAAAAAIAAGGALLYSRRRKAE